MKKLISCKSCGAKFEQDLPKCPYCGTLNYKGAEKEYLNKLESIKEDLEDLQEVPEHEIKKEIKKQGGFVGKVLLIVSILMVGLFLFFYWQRRDWTRDRKADYLWMQENYPSMDELYEKKQYEQLMSFFLDAIEEEKPIWDWEHADFCNIYLDIMEGYEILDMELAGQQLSKGDYGFLFYCGWIVKGIAFRDNIKEEEAERLSTYGVRMLSDFESRWNMNQEDYHMFLEQIEKNQGIVNYDDCAKYIQNWYEEEE